MKMKKKFGDPADQDNNTYYKHNATWRLKDSGTFINLYLESDGLVSIYYYVSEH